MKKFLTYIICITSLLAASSCGEDRTYELKEKTQHNEWILEVMRDTYLWGDSLGNYEPEWKNYFSKPEDFLKTVIGKTGQSDKWSFFDNDTLSVDAHPHGHFNHISSYGIDFVLMNDPTGQTSKSFLRITTVFPNSPASEAGLHRNDFISMIDGEKVSTNNVAKLEKGASRKLSVLSLESQGEELALVGEHEVHIGMSRYVEDEAFPVTSIVQAYGIQVGYLQCTRLVPYAIEQEKMEDSKEYVESLDRAMARLKSAEISELVLDLRHCNYGTIDMAQRLASYIVNPKYLNSTFLKTEWRASLSENNKNIPYDTSVNNLHLGRVFILVSASTQGAAEWLIQGLRATMGDEKVVLIGKSTVGQNVMTEEVGYKYHLRFNPVVAYVGDCNGNHEYKSIKPDVDEDEFAYVELLEYGNMYEALFAKALEIIAN